MLHTASKQSHGYNIHLTVCKYDVRISPCEDAKPEGLLELEGGMQARRSPDNMRVLFAKNTNKYTNQTNTPAQKPALE